MGVTQKSRFINVRKVYASVCKCIRREIDAAPRYPRCRPSSPSMCVVVRVTLDALDVGDAPPGVFEHPWSLGANERKRTFMNNNSS